MGREDFAFEVDEALRKMRERPVEEVLGMPRDELAKLMRDVREAERRGQYIQSTYGLSKFEYRAMFEAQGKACAICGTKEPGRRGWVVDHDHKTGKVRGILCLNCNSGIGMLQDDPDVLRKAANYLVEEMK